MEGSRGRKMLMAALNQETKRSFAGSSRQTPFKKKKSDDDDYIPDFVFDSEDSISNSLEIE
ncbi:hypothetical protein J6590_105712, partial [Homalodisca vitripennis]